MPLKLIANGSRRWDSTLAEIAEFTYVLWDCGISCEQGDQAQWEAGDAILRSLAS